MKLTPLKGKLVIKLDEAPEKIGTMYVPDSDSIKVCAKCGLTMEALDGPCAAADDIFELEKRRDVLHFRGQDTSHDIQYVKREVVVSPMRPATVLAVGAGLGPDIIVGSRILIHFASGRSLDPDDANSPYREVSEQAVTATLEGE